ncbi:hypothetical protein COOONC_20866 [Cooperia oncophora]
MENGAARMSARNAIMGENVYDIDSVKVLLRQSIRQFERSFSKRGGGRRQSGIEDKDTVEDIQWVCELLPGLWCRSLRRSPQKMPRRPRRTRKNINHAGHQ